MKGKPLSIKRFAVYPLLTAAAVLTLGTGAATAGIPLQPAAPAPGPAGSHAHPLGALPTAGSHPVCIPGNEDLSCLLASLLSASA